MSLERFIAIRYLFARRNKSVVTVISWISLIGLTVSTAALIIVLSVYNGIGELTKGLFGTFDPELVIEPAQGKTFHASEVVPLLRENKDVDYCSQIVSETAWVTYGDNQAIVRLRGVDANYPLISGLDTLLYDGHYTVNIDGMPALIVGGEVFQQLGMRLLSNMPAAVHIPKRGTTSMGFTMDQAFNIGYAYPVALFFIQQDLDRQQVVTDIAFVRSLMNYAPDECTAIALRLRQGSNPQKVKRQLSSSLNAHHLTLIIKDRYDQQPLYFKIFRTERIGIYLILSLIVLISTLSLIASLSLLVLNKSRDIFILKSMGLSRKRIRATFRTEGILICTVALVAGLAIGFVICLLQQQFGIIRMGDGNFVVSAFPVAMRGIDFLLTALLVTAISSLSVALTVQHAKI